MAWAGALLFIEEALGRAGQVGIEIGKIVLDLGKTFLYLIGGAVAWLLGFFSRNFKDPRIVAACSVFFLFFTIALIVLLGAAHSLIVGPGGVAAGAGAGDLGAGFADGGVYYASGGVPSASGGVSGSSEAPGGSGAGAGPGVSPDLCENGFCDNLLSGSKSLDMGSLVFGSCSDSVMYYDIPYYCVRSGASLKKYVWRQYAGDVAFYSAACGRDSLEAVLSPKCSLDGGVLRYAESSGNCPADCSADNCLKDLSCDLNPGNCGAYFCCPAGSMWAGRCLRDFTSNDLAACNNPALDLPSLAAARQVRVNCACSSSSECASDFGGSTCCAAGTYHAGFCYNSLSCN